MTIIELLISDIKDPKTLQLRAGTILLALLSYWVVAYQTEILEGFKNLSSETVITKMEEARAKAFPAQARQEAISILTQLSQNHIIVIEYEPQFLNNYITVHASEGVLPIQASLLNNITVDKSSEMYMQHLQDRAVAGELGTQGDSWKAQQLVIPEDILVTQGQKYYYAQPIYDLSGVYQGVIVQLWKDVPKVQSQLKSFELLAYFDSRIQSSRRSLQRQK